jgi:Fe-S cluster biogenesis protein NfuA
MTPFIYTEVTPNPATLKFVVGGATLARAPADFDSPAAAARAPLARRLFGVPGVERVFVGGSFVSVTKAAAAAWDAVAPLVEEVIRAHLASGEPAVETSAPGAPADAGSADDVSAKIRRILDEEIRPAVAMDGGDIRFVGYRDGVVTLHLQGACHACPSATMTLRMGVENRLRASIPEVREIVQV